MAIEMLDPYKIDLRNLFDRCIRILAQLANAGIEPELLHTPWPKELAIDLEMWEKSKNFGRHLTHYGGMGSLTDAGFSHRWLNRLWNSASAAAEQSAWGLKEGKAYSDMYDLSPRRHGKIEPVAYRCTQCKGTFTTMWMVNDCVSNLWARPYFFYEVFSLGTDEIIDRAKQDNSYPTHRYFIDFVTSRCEQSSIRISESMKLYPDSCPKCANGKIEYLDATPWDFDLENENLVIPYPLPGLDR